jgi:SAM-dependent methyltransferase
LSALEPVPTALEQARRATAGHGRVQIRRGSLPDDWPNGDFDLIVFSEVGYYLDAHTWRTTLDRALEALRPDGDLVLVHWRPAVAQYPLSGDQVHRAAREHPGLVRLVAHEEDDFLLDVLRRPPGHSVATVEGLR